MSDTLTVRVPVHEKAAWKKIAQTVGETLSEFARKAVRQQVQAVQAVQAKQGLVRLGTAAVTGRMCKIINKHRPWYGVTAK